jgi:hypothetical protein
MSYNDNIGTGSLPFYLNTFNSAKEFSFQEQTSIKGNFLDISKESILIQLPIVVNDSTLVEDSFKEVEKR